MYELVRFRGTIYCFNSRVMVIVMVTLGKQPSSALERLCSELRSLAS